MRQILQTILIVWFIFGTNQSANAQKNLENQISDSLTAIANSYTYVGRVNVSTVLVNTSAESITVIAPDKFSYMPFRPASVTRIYNAIRVALPSKYAGYTISCQTERRNIEDLIPNFYRPENPDTTRIFALPPSALPLVSNLSRPYDITAGLLNRHIALWQSHGKYYDQKTARWVWQRPRILQTVEDLYTQSYVLPFLVPMLENAGANVLIPRERDTQLHEVVVDNDSCGTSRYREHNERKSWVTGADLGFANTRKFYLQGENPFTYGTYRVIQGLDDEEETSSVQWLPDLPEAGRYAVYVSYKSLANSVPDARYTIYHRGIKTEFRVNQQMNGGTWLYLGHFYFDKGRNNQNKVVLSNYSEVEDALVTADAVKFGGGLGNMARAPQSNSTSSPLASSDTLSLIGKPASLTFAEPETSHYPRYTEGARYWLQWAGIPDSVYCRTQGKNDYSDDFQSRGFWVNYISGGSAVAPNKSGLQVPVDLALGFHTDAGTTANDSIIGTLGICSVPNTNGKTFYENGVSRWASRDMTDIVMSQIVDDVRHQFAPEWTRRGLWNKSYSESRVPEVPTMLLELLSHQNFADMRYGHDPRFRFAVSRSIYKGVLKYLSAVHKTGYVVQPLPVEQFSCRFVEKNKVELHWVAVADSLEPTANAEKYVVYTRVDDGDFDNGVLVSSNRVTSTIQTGKIYSFKVVAVNKGGQSFPSEILSVCRSSSDRGVVMVVNGFDRVSAPASFSVDSTYAGFYNDVDPGVPYVSDISFIGRQFEYKRDKPWINDDAPGFGASHGDYETTEIAGNTFDYPYVHGKAIRSAGYSFVSSSLKSVTRGDIDLTQYKMVDLILGQQKQTFIGNARKAPEFKTFPLALQESLQRFCSNGGNLLLSGSYIASDVSEGKGALRQDRDFLQKTLKYKYRTSHASVKGNVQVLNAPFRQFKKQDLTYFDQPNSISYCVTAPDALEPAGEGSYTICRYAENNTSAAVAYLGKYRTCALGFPFEAIKTDKERARLMESVLQFFVTKYVDKKK